MRLAPYLEIAETLGVQTAERHFAKALEVERRKAMERAAKILRRSGMVDAAAAVELHVRQLREMDKAIDGY
jgi:hypothetical protein